MGQTSEKYSFEQQIAILLDCKSDMDSEIAISIYDRNFKSNNYLSTSILAFFSIGLL
jgi:hypothetical protein